MGVSTSFWCSVETITGIAWMDHCTGVIYLLVLTQDLGYRIFAVF